jgi:hypothetical protein
MHTKQFFDTHNQGERDVSITFFSHFEEGTARKTSMPCGRDIQTLGLCRNMRFGTPYL